MASDAGRREDDDGDDGRAGEGAVGPLGPPAPPWQLVQFWMPSLLKQTKDALGGV